METHDHATPEHDSAGEREAEHDAARPETLIRIASAVGNQAMSKVLQRDSPPPPPTLARVETLQGGFATEAAAKLAAAYRREELARLESAKNTLSYQVGPIAWNIRGTDLAGTKPSASSVLTAYSRTQTLSGIVAGGLGLSEEFSGHVRMLKSNLDEAADTLFAVYLEDNDIDRRGSIKRLFDHHSAAVTAAINSAAGSSDSEAESESDENQLEPHQVAALRGWVEQLGHLGAAIVQPDEILTDSHMFRIQMLEFRLQSFVASTPAPVAETLRSALRGLSQARTLLRSLMHTRGQNISAARETLHSASKISDILEDRVEDAADELSKLIKAGESGEEEAASE